MPTIMNVAELLAELKRMLNIYNASVKKIEAHIQNIEAFLADGNISENNIIVEDVMSPIRARM